MSQTKIPKLKVINKKPGSITTGASTAVFLDGKLLDSLHFLKIEIKAKKVAKVTMEMYADVDIEMDTEPIISTTEYKEGPNFKLGQYSPCKIEPYAYQCDNCKCGDKDESSD